jgi:hypothetical protein
MAAIIDEETGEVLSANGGELTVEDRAKLALNKNDDALIELAARSRGLLKIETKDHYAEIKTAENVLVKTRLNIKEVGKAARDDATKFSKAVIAEENRLVALIEPEEERLKKLRFDWDEAIRIENGKEFAIAEEKRKRLEALDASLDVGLNFGDGVAQVEARIQSVSAVVIDDADLNNENRQRLELKKLTTLNTLNNALQVAKNTEAANASALQLKQLQEAQQAEQAAKDAAETKRKAALENAPDAEKLNEWVANIRRVEFPAMTSVHGKQTKVDIIAQLDSLLTRVSGAAKKMTDLQ